MLALSQNYLIHFFDTNCASLFFAFIGLNFGRVNQRISAFSRRQFPGSGIIANPFGEKKYKKR